MLRRFLSLLLAAALLPFMWFYDAVPRPDYRPNLTLRPLDLPAERRRGMFELTGAWQLTSTNVEFGGYSALVIPRAGEFLALSDRGNLMRFAQPGSAGSGVVIGSALSGPRADKNNRDIESAFYDPVSARLWLALEGRGTVYRFDPDQADPVQRDMPGWQDWPTNTGPEAMTRLRDGRFVVLCECYSGWFDHSTHPAFRYAGDPVTNPVGEPFTFVGAPGYRPTDMAQLPDGRVLIVMRRLVWPAPARFAIKLMLADPRGIAAGKPWPAEEAIDISAPWPVDNYEALAVQPGPDGGAIIWLMSDENGAVSQRVLLLRLELKVAAPQPKQKAPG